MTGGFGRARWGLGPWGSSDPSSSNVVPPFEDGLYPVPHGVRFGRAAISKFTGEPTSGPLSGANGLLFFSAALMGPSSSNSVDFALVEMRAIPSDSYVRPPERSGRLFRFGGTSFASRTNNDLYRSQPLEYRAIATLTQTIPPGPTTVIRVF